MYIKGCENSKVAESVEESKLYAENAKKIYGYYEEDGRKMEWDEKSQSFVENPSKRKPMVFDEFLGRYIEDRNYSPVSIMKDGKWIDVGEYKKSRKRAKQTPLMLMRSDTPSYITKRDSQGKAYERKIIPETKYRSI